MSWPEYDRWLADLSEFEVYDLMDDLADELDNPFQTVTAGSESRTVTAGGTRRTAAASPVSRSAALPAAATPRAAPVTALSSQAGASVARGVTPTP